MTPAPRRIDPGIRSLCCVLVAALALGACGTPNAQSLLLVIEGHDNHVELRKADDEVRDLGSGNWIKRRG